jgi:hypothetical protein
MSAQESAWQEEVDTAGALPQSGARPAPAVVVLPGLRQPIDSSDADTDVARHGNDGQHRSGSATGTASRTPLTPIGTPRTTTTAASSDHSTTGRLVLVLNSGSSSVKFALVLPGSGERLMRGIGERLGTPEAAVRAELHEFGVCAGLLEEA